MLLQFCPCHGDFRQSLVAEIKACCPWPKSPYAKFSFAVIMCTEKQSDRHNEWPHTNSIVVVNNFNGICMFTTHADLFWHAVCFHAALALYNFVQNDGNRNTNAWHHVVALQIHAE